MELLFGHLIGFILSLDERGLKPLRVSVPDFREVLADPRRALQHREIEIGPWTRYMRSYFIPVMLLGLLLTLSTALDSLPVTIALTVVWLVISLALVSYGRGGRCIMGVQGVEFHYGSFAIFCPWDVFHVAGQPHYHPNSYRLDLPVNMDAIMRIEVRKDDSPLEGGPPPQARHFQILPTGNVRLRCVYRVRPNELGDFLLALGRKLGQASDPGALEEGPRPRHAPFSHGEAGWIVVSLTRFRFPPVCCDCGRATDDFQQFHGHRSMFASGLSEEESVIIAAPVCNECRADNRRRYWRTFLKTVVLTVVGATVLGFVLGAILDLCGATPGPGAMTVIMTCSALVVSLACAWFVGDHFARMASAPLILKDYRPADGTIRVRFRNPQYVEFFRA